jgi:fucose 4-O-acetylase-like acetyltransferase
MSGVNTFGLVHRTAASHVSTSYNMLLRWMPSECALSATIGGIQLYLSIWLQVFSVNWKPPLFIFGYIAALSHLIISGMIVRRNGMLLISKCILAGVCIIAVVSSICIIYFLRNDNKNGYIFIDLINFYAIIVVVIWGGIAFHNIGKISMRYKQFDDDDIEIFQGV